MPHQQVFLSGWERYQQGDFRGAAEFYLAAIQLSPLWFEPYYHAAACYQSLRDYAPAMGFYMAALGLKSGTAPINYHAAKCLKDSGHLEAAFPLYRKALELQPELHDAKYSLELLHFLQGNWLEGWKGYGLRGLGSDRAKTEKLTNTGDLIRWIGGEVPVGSKLLVTCEQGMGDALMAFRFAPLLRELFTSVGITVHAPLVQLCKANAPDGVNVNQWDTAPIDLGEYTHTIALMDLPAAFATTPENVPNKPYLVARQSENTALVAVLNELSSNPKFKIGVVWQGGKVSVANGRDVEFHTLLPLLQDVLLNEKVQWVSLQKDIKVDGLPNLLNAMLAVQNFADTAALVEKLDLVIAVDTAVAHLAGAMGQPVWLLNRFESEWRWMRNKTNTPWYPSMRIFNEPQPGCWASVVSNVKNSLVNELDQLREFARTNDPI